MVWQAIIPCTDDYRTNLCLGVMKEILSTDDLSRRWICTPVSNSLVDLHCDYELIQNIVVVRQCFKSFYMDPSLIISRLPQQALRCHEDIQGGSWLNAAGYHSISTQLKVITLQ
jgi:hypothetical protein